MLQKLESNPVEAPEAAAVLVRSADQQEGDCDYDDGLLPTATRIMGLAYGGGLGIVAFTLMASREALFAIVISTGYALIYFLVPTLMTRMRAGHDPRWRVMTADEARQDVVSTFTGRIRRPEALLQMVIVPLAVAFAFAGLSLIWVLNRP